VDRLFICKECEKPDSKQVKGRPMKGKKLAKALKEADLGVEVVPCKCLGKCKKGPNGLAMPGRVRLHRLSLKKVRKLVRGQDT
jgi:predicted metal-binding protein